MSVCCCESGTRVWGDCAPPEDIRVWRCSQHKSDLLNRLCFPVEGIHEGQVLLFMHLLVFYSGVNQTPAVY